MPYHSSSQIFARKPGEEIGLRQTLTAKWETLPFWELAETWVQASKPYLTRVLELQSRCPVYPDHLRSCCTPHIFTKSFSNPRTPDKPGKTKKRKKIRTAKNCSALFPCTVRFWTAPLTHFGLPQIPVPKSLIIADSRTWYVLGSWYEGTSRDWAWWRLAGWGAGRPRRKEGEWGEGPSLAITTMFCSEFA